MNIRQEQIIKVTEVTIVMYCKADWEIWKREVVVVRVESPEGANSAIMSCAIV